MNSKYRVAVIDSMAGMAEMARPWNDLLTQSRSNTIFLTWEWLYSWAECYLRFDRELFIIAVYKEDELVGVAPWSIRQTRYLGLPMKIIEFLGTPEAGSDYLDIFAKPGREKEVAERIYHFLQEETSRWDSLTLRDIASNSLFLLHFLGQIDSDGKYAEIDPGSFCPVVILPKNRSEFLAQLSPNRRQQFLRHFRILQKEGEATHHSIRAEKVQLALKDFYRIYEQRWKDASGHFQFMEKFIHRTEGKDWVQIDCLNTRGQNIAYLIHLRYGSTLSMYLMAVDHSFNKSISIGNILVGLSIEKAIEEGFSKYDFLKGGEDYKFHWSNNGERAVNLYYYGKKMAPLMWVAAKFLKSAAKILLR